MDKFSMIATILFGCAWMCYSMPTSPPVTPTLPIAASDALQNVTAGNLTANATALSNMSLTNPSPNFPAPLSLSSPNVTSANPFPNWRLPLASPNVSAVNYSPNTWVAPAANTIAVKRDAPITVQPVARQDASSADPARVKHDAPITVQPEITYRIAKENQLSAINVREQRQYESTGNISSTTTTLSPRIKKQMKPQHEETDNSTVIVDTISTCEGGAINP